MDKVREANKLNNYANYIVESFIHDYNDSLSETQKEFGKMLSEVDFILVEDAITNMDMFYKVKKREDRKFMADARILVPLVSNGKVEGDGNIHVYPDSIESEEIPKSKLFNVIEKRVLHEVIAKFIRPETPFDDVVGSAEVEADHYFSSGLVEYYSRTLDKRRFNGNGDERFDESYNDINLLVKSFKRMGLSSFEINRLIFTSNYVDILNTSDVGKEMLDRYLNDALNRKAIDKLKKDIFKSINMSKDDIKSFNERTKYSNNKEILMLLREEVVSSKISNIKRNNVLNNLDYFFRDIVDDNEINSSSRMFV